MKKVNEEMDLRKLSKLKDLKDKTVFRRYILNSLIDEISKMDFFYVLDDFYYGNKTYSARGFKPCAIFTERNVIKLTSHGDIVINGKSVDGDEKTCVLIYSITKRNNCIQINSNNIIPSEVIKMVGKAIGRNKYTVKVPEKVDSYNWFIANFNISNNVELRVEKLAHGKWRLNYASPKLIRFDYPFIVEEKEEKSIPDRLKNLCESIWIENKENKELKHLELYENFHIKKTRNKND